MRQRVYIDVNSSIGRMSYREENVPYKVESLMDNMKYYKVHASMVCSNVGKDYSFVKGNRQIQEAARDNRRLYGAATVVPEIKYESEKGGEYLAQLHQSGIKAFKLYPKTLSHGFDPFYIGNLAEFMTDKHIPLLVDSNEIEWHDLKENLRAFPKLNIILCNSHWSTNRFLLPIMERFGNLYFDISSNQAFDIFKICKEHFGVDRVLFGSDYPFKVIGGLKALLEYSDLSEEDKDKIAWANASKLLNIDKPALYSEEESMLDEIAAIVDSGLPLDNIFVIDAHTHLLDKEDTAASGSIMINGAEDRLIQKMDMLGIDKMFICPWEGLSIDGTSANETSLAAGAKYRDRIEVYAMCNPNYREDLEAVVDVYHEKYKFKGLKPYFLNNKYDLLGEKYYEWFEYGNKNKLIMLVHTDTPGIPAKVEELSGKYKDMVFLMAHSGASYKTAGENIEVVKKRDNVFLEITHTKIREGIIEYMVGEVGAEKVIFGTDMPMRDPAPQLAWVCYARITAADKRKILGLNMKHLIERCYS